MLLWLFGAIISPQRSAAHAQAQQKPTAEELAAITKRGTLLAEYDRTVWDATDAVQAAHPTPTHGQRYIAHQTDNGWMVDFGSLNEAGDKFLVSYEATATGPGPKPKFTVQDFSPPREDSGWNVAAAKALATALKDFKAAPRPYNYALLPAESGEIYVYLYPAQTDKNVYPLGADARYRISADGATIVEKRQMHKAVIESKAPPGGDKKWVSGVHAHVLSDVPEDSDVMMVLIRQPSVPEIVATQSFTYTIATDGSIKVEKR